jgi:hypothetical protein
MNHLRSALPLWYDAVYIDRSLPTFRRDIPPRFRDWDQLFLKDPTEYIFSPSHLRTETDPVSKTLCLLVSRIPDDGQSPKKPVIPKKIRVDSDFCFMFCTFRGFLSDPEKEIFSETSTNFCHTIRCHITGEDTIHSNRSENLKPLCLHSKGPSLSN